MLSQELSETPNLTVYRASAGSGKTFRLTGEYLLLLFSSPFAYKHILAVTFTNRATEEMKYRIVQELANLAMDRDSGYIQELTKAYSKSEASIRDQARKILISILHDYSAFSVSTIDRFFQQTMRAFTREIGLGGGYNVELDTGKVLGEAIDSMLYDLERTENQQLLDWLIRFSEEKIENGETWNIRSDIQSLASEIFKETYKAFSDDIQIDIANKTLLDDYKKTLLSSISQFEKHSREIAEKALNTMLRFNLKPDDFKGGARSTFFSFQKWANGEIKEPTNTFKKLLDDPSSWYIKTTSSQIQSQIEDAFNNGLNTCVCDIIELYDNSIIYQSAYEINRYFFTLGILGDVDKKIREYAAENNVMLISDTTELLSKIIKGTDTPFVYEKVGTRIDNYMIDEFQDTSNMQWKNFLPLVRDSLAQGNKNLIVGDVKQSIYRWRNSDWKLLDEQLDFDFQTNGVEHKSLDTNWRSLPNIINFNNAIFETGPNLLQDLFNGGLENIANDSALTSFHSRIKKAYQQSYQYISDKVKDNDKKGSVSINFIDIQENANWQSQVLDELPKNIEELQDKGYSLKEIAILVRTKKEGAEVANKLLEYKGLNPQSKYKYDIISDEALFIKNSKSIKLAISLFKYLRNPTDSTLRSLAIYEYYRFKNQLTPEQTIQSHLSESDRFPADVSVELQRIKELPLYEMTEEIFDLFRDAMETNENIYIQAFLDMVLDFSVNRSSDLDSFLQWWLDTGQTKTIYTPDGQDAIRIMTIHKSKGLEFKTVIIPFCNWDIDHKLANIIWCQPRIAPFNQLKLVPVKYSQKLQNTIFAHEYFDEKLHAYIDNLNILYVAFTRAKENLIAYTPKPKDEKKGISNISSLLWASVHIGLEFHPDKVFIDLAQSMDDQENIFHLGEMPTCENEKYLLADSEVSIGTLESIPFDERLKLKLNNRFFFKENGQREYGTLMHDIVSQISTVNDIDEILEVYQLMGEITDLERQNISSLLFEYLSKPQILKWYSGEYRILNEVQILQPNGTFIRPDRVMIKNDEVVVIDYKFGEKEEKKYIRQVKNYMNQIQKMGYNNVKGYICYITLGIINEVE